MAGLISDTLGGTDTWESMGTAAPSSVLERVDPFALTEQVGRAIGNTAAEYGNVDEYGRQTSAPEPAVPTQDLNQKYGVPDTGGTGVTPLQFDAPLPDSVGQSMQAAKLDEIARKDASNRQPSGLLPTLSNFAVGLLDPVNAAATFVPVIGEARMAGLLAKGGMELGAGLVGKTALRAATGAAAGATAQVPLIGLRYGMSQQEHADYTMSDALADLAMGTVLGGGLHAAIGGAGDALGQVFGRTGAARIAEDDPIARADALRTAVAAGVEDRPVVVDPVLEYAQLTAERDRLHDELLRTSRDNLLNPESDELTDGAPQDATATPSPDANQTSNAEPISPVEGVAPPDDAAGALSAREQLQAAIERNQARMSELEEQIRNSDAAERARGAPPPEDALTSRQAEATAKAPAEPVPSDIQAQIAELERQITGADKPQAATENGETPAPKQTAATDLAPEHAAALNEINAASENSNGFIAGLKQASACLLRGIA